MALIAITKNQLCWCVAMIKLTLPRNVCRETRTLCSGMCCCNCCHKAERGESMSFSARSTQEHAN